MQCSIFFKKSRSFFVRQQFVPLWCRCLGTFCPCKRQFNSALCIIANYSAKLFSGFYPNCSHLIWFYITGIADKRNLASQINLSWRKTFSWPCILLFTSVWQKLQTGEEKTAPSALQHTQIQQWRVCTTEIQNLSILKSGIYHLLIFVFFSSYYFIRDSVI